jgi:hypothetical protein
MILICRAAWLGRMERKMSIQERKEGRNREKLLRPAARKTDNQGGEVMSHEKNQSDDAQSNGATQPPNYLIQPLNRSVLVACSLRVSRLETVEFQAEIVGSCADDEDRNRKAAILSIAWCNKEGMILPTVQRGFSNSEKYGYFRYVPFLAQEGHENFAVSLTGPEDADCFFASFIRFSNSSLSLVSSRVVRLGHSKS